LRFQVIVQFFEAADATQNFGCGETGCERAGFFFVSYHPRSAATKSFVLPRQPHFWQTPAYMKTTTPPVGNLLTPAPARRGLLLIPLLLACFALLPRAQAVVPAPDGGYPGNNTAEGPNALFSLTTGINNTAVGANALLKTTDGGYNAAFGSRALENQYPRCLQHGGWDPGTLQQYR